MARSPTGEPGPAPTGGKAVGALAPGRLRAFLQGVLLIGFIVALVVGQWLNAALTAGILGLTLLPSLIARRLRLIVPPELELSAVAFLFAALFLGEVGDFYARYWWWDVALHTTSGFLLGVFGFLLVWVLNEDEHLTLDLSKGFISLFAFCFAVAAGALWEIFEFAMDSIFGLNMQKSGLVDTMADLIVDAVGALAIAVLGYGWLRTPDVSFLERWIEQVVDANPRLFRRPRD